MHKECADQLAAAGLPVVLQLGETQSWYFPSASGMLFYDEESKADFFARFGRPLLHFAANTDNPEDERQAADFLRDRIWEYCADVIVYVRLYHPTAVFECPIAVRTPSPGWRRRRFYRRPLSAGDRR